MEQSVAIHLINKGVDASRPGVWADLGAGSGVFTKALATLLGRGSVIYAIDQHQAALDQLETASHQAVVNKAYKNFVTDELNLPALDGILMANSLHYVKTKDLFLYKLKTMLKPGGRLLIVEYDTMLANTWVPYPIDFASLAQLMSRAGFPSVEKLAEQPSQFRQGNIYSALIH